MADVMAPDNHEAPLIAIGVLAERVGLSVSAVRKYEREGLLIAHRTNSGRRLFSHEDISRVRNIQHLIQDVGLNIEGIRRLQAMLPCWDLLPCSAEMRASCAAYEEQKQPCWMIKGKDCAPQGNECRQCVVYRFGSLCTEEIKHLMHDPSEDPDTGLAIKTLLERRRHLYETET